MQFEITSNNIFVFDTNGNGKLTGEKFPIDEDVNALKTIMDAATLKMMKIIHQKKKQI